MHPNCCKKIGVGCSQNDRHGCPGGVPGDINAIWINCPGGLLPLDSLDYSRKYCRFPTPTIMIGRGKPVPTQVLIVGPRLLWIDHHEPILLCQPVHLRPSSEVPGRLCTAMQHDDERDSCSHLILCWRIDAIRMTTSGAIIRVLLPHNAPSHKIAYASNIYMHFTFICKSCQELNILINGLEYVPLSRSCCNSMLKNQLVPLVSISVDSAYAGTPGPAGAGANSGLPRQGGTAARP